MNLDSSILSYPVLVRYRSICVGMKDRDSLTRTTSAGVKNGIYEKYYIIDSALVEYRVTAVNVLGGVGPFFGFNLFLNRNVRVELELEVRNKQYEFAELKGIVMKELQKWKGWKSRDDYSVLMQAASSAESTNDLIGALTR